MPREEPTDSCRLWVLLQCIIISLLFRSYIDCIIESSRKGCKLRYLVLVLYLCKYKKRQQRSSSSEKEESKMIVMMEPTVMCWHIVCLSCFEYEPGSEYTYYLGICLGIRIRRSIKSDPTGCLE